MIQAVIDNGLFQRLDVAKSGHVFGLTTSVTDYATATQWVEEIEQKVLAVV